MFVNLGFLKSKLSYLTIGEYRQDGSPCIMVCSTVGDTMINVGDILSTVGCSVPWRDIMRTVGGYLEYRGGCSVPWGDIMVRTWGDIMVRTWGGYHEYRGGCSVPWGENLLLFEYPTVQNTHHGTHDIPPQVS